LPRPQGIHDISGAYKHGMDISLKLIPNNPLSNYFYQQFLHNMLDILKENLELLIEGQCSF